MGRREGLADYPYGLLLEVQAGKRLELPASLTKDVQAGITYALSTLEETERDVLDRKYRLGEDLSEDQHRIVSQALKKLCHPSRWDYICYGIVGCGKRKAEAAKRKGIEQGYREGRAVAAKEHGLDGEVTQLDLPLETMPLSTRTCNALREGGCKTVRDVAVLDIEAIRTMRGLGEKGAKEIMRILRSYGLVHTAWELY